MTISTKQLLALQEVRNATGEPVISFVMKKHFNMNSHVINLLLGFDKLKINSAIEWTCC